MARHTVNINGEALKSGITNRGFKLTEASEMLGYDPSYISRIAHSGQMNKRLLKTISMLFMVEPEQYVVKEPEQMVIDNTIKQSKQEIIIDPQISEEQWARLEKLIYEAVTRALKGSEAKT